MTKQDYELIAEAIRGAAKRMHDHFSVRSHDIKSQVVTETAVAEVIANSFSVRLNSTNPRFDMGRFIRACTGEDDRPYATERRKASLKAGKERVRRAMGGK